MQTFAGSFAADVVAVFPIGRVHHVGPLTSYANRLWRVVTSDGTFVVKAFVFEELGHHEALRRAAAFERSVLAHARVAMAAPVASVRGELIERVRGWGAAEVLVRVHAWTDGVAVDVPAGATIAHDAGRTLAGIQRLGRLHATVPSGDLRARSATDPRVVLDELQWPDGHDVLARATDVIDAANALDGDWVFTHYDFKPENCLVSADRLLVLDWDECTFCHPRLEAVESALRWAGVHDGLADRDSFVAFLQGYGDVGALSPADFGKHIAGLAGWFGFMGQRSLGVWGGSDADRDDAREMARTALNGLGAALDALDGWAAWRR